MTELEIYEKLGLMPPGLDTMKKLHELVSDVPDVFIVEWPRCTGRTTNMLIRALYHSQFGNVLVLAHNWSYARLLKRTIWEYAERLGLDRRRIKIDIPHEPYTYQGLRLQYWEADHLVRERDGVSPELETMLNLRALEPCSEIEEHGAQGRSTQVR